MAAALFGGAASVLGAGSAQAVQWFTFNPLTPPNPAPITLGDKTFTFISFTDNGGCVGGCDVEVTGAAMGPYQVDIDFNVPPLGSAPGPFQGSFEYQVTINDPGYEFMKIEFDPSVSSSGTATSVLTKDVTWATGSTTLVSSPTSYPMVSYSLPGGLTSITVKDNWDVKTNDNIDNIINTVYQDTVATPGPLPLLGAGAAFGLSRRIRSRIRASVLSS